MSGGESKLIRHVVHVCNIKWQGTLYSRGKSCLKGEINTKMERVVKYFPHYLAEDCNLKDRLRQGQFLLYRPILYIQQWIYTLNEMEGKEMLKSPSKEVLSTGA